MKQTEIKTCFLYCFLKFNVRFSLVYVVVSFPLFHLQLFTSTNRIFLFNHSVNKRFIYLLLTSFLSFGWNLNQIERSFRDFRIILLWFHRTRWKLWVCIWTEVVIWRRVIIFNYRDAVSVLWQNLVKLLSFCETWSRNTLRFLEFVPEDEDVGLDLSFTWGSLLRLFTDEHQYQVHCLQMLTPADVSFSCKEELGFLTDQKLWRICLI